MGGRDARGSGGDDRKAPEGKLGTGPLLDFVREREAIRLKKESGARQPWTRDPILMAYRFCNVRRRDDRVSKWLLKNVLTEENLKKAGDDSFLLFTAFCRFVNWPPTLLAIMKKGLWPVRDIDLSAIGNHVDVLMNDGDKVWTGAYMVRAEPGSTKPKGMHIAEDVIRDGLGPLLSQLERILELRHPLRREVWMLLQTARCWGSFMAGQVVDDWAMTPMLADAMDHYTWAPQGPGSQRGLNRLLGEPLKQQWKDDEFCLQLVMLRNEIISELGKSYEDVTLHDVQNCLCELDKYLRAKNNEGKPRSYYEPETAY